MKQNRRSFVGVSLLALVVMVIFFLVRLTMHATPEVALPTLDDAVNGAGTSSDAQMETIRRVEVTPDTVQLVIERLARPENYCRTITIRRFWAGGNGESRAETAFDHGWTRLDMAQGDFMRHVIIGGEQTYVWYDGDTAVFTSAAALSADEEESIPTYETILALAKNAITAADYRARDGVNCIYVETRADDAGYTERYWISADNGLLVAAERVQGETVIYEMTALEVSVNSVDAASFTLPDGTVLHDPADADTKKEG